MENCNEKMAVIGEKVTSIADLLEIAKCYCDFNIGKCSELSSLGTMLEFILKEQKELAEILDLDD